MITQKEASDLLKKYKLYKANDSQLSLPHFIEKQLIVDQFNWLISFWQQSALDFTWVEIFELISTGDDIHKDYNIHNSSYVSKVEETISCLHEMKCAGKVYISGPMTGKDRHNYPRFGEISGILSFDSIPHFNPASRGKIKGYKHHNYLKDDYKELSQCDCVLRMDGWQESLGASEEIRSASILFKMPIFHIDNNNYIKIII